MTLNQLIPTDALNGRTRIVLTGREQMLIEQHRGIIGYGKEKLTLRLSDGYVSVLGQNLFISEYNHQEILVSGKILSVEFSK